MTRNLLTLISLVLLLLAVSCASEKHVVTTPIPPAPQRN